MADYRVESMDDRVENRGSAKSPPAEGVRLRWQEIPVRVRTNILLSPERVWFVDWPHACVGAPWVYIVAFAPSVAMQGGPQPEQVIARHPACRTADPDAITAVVVALAGYFTHGSLQPAPPGLPTLRAFQMAQGVVARDWAARRTGWF